MEKFWSALFGFIIKMCIICIPVFGYAIDVNHPGSFAFSISAIITYVLLDVFGKNYNKFNL